MSADESEFRALHDAYAPRIRRYLARLAGEGEADDLTQVVFARAHRAMGSRRGESSLSTWLYRIATNAALDRLRRPASRREVPLAAVAGSAGPCEDGGEVAIEGAAAAESQVIREEMRHCILDFVDRLPPSYRAVILLGELQELTDREIAAVLGVSLGAAKIRLHRARGALKRFMEAGCDLYRDERNELACEPKGAPEVPAGGREAGTEAARPPRPQGR